MNAKLNDNEDGFLAIQPGETTKNGEACSEDKIIGVNLDRSLDWKRFIIAHEFGHFILRRRCLCQKSLLNVYMINLKTVD